MELLKIDADTSPAAEAFARLPEATRVRCLEASRVTAEAIVREARARLQRQLGPHATGQTVAGIQDVEARDGDGYIVFADREPLANLPLWLEKGTKPGQRRNFARTEPRPFFYASIELEVGAHEQRIAAAMADAGEDVGLGD